MSSDASESALARTPSSGSSRAGFQSTTSRSARADESESTTVAGRPVSASASSPAFAIVADASRNCGSAPYVRASRCSRRSTLPTCDPKTPR